MNYKTYKLTQEEKLKDIAAKFNTTEAEIKRLNPEMKIIKLPLMDAVVAYGEDIIVPDHSGYQEQQDKLINEETQYHKEVRYRCEQANNTTIDNQSVSTSLQKTQYAIKLNELDKIAKVKLDDYYYSMTPSFLNEVFEFIKKTEFIRNNVKIKFLNTGMIDKVLNKNEQRLEWVNFKNSADMECTFINELKKNDTHVYNQLIETGDKQFSINHESEYEYMAAPFYMLFFDEYLLNDDFVPEQIYTKQIKSTLFPSLDFELEIQRTKVTETEEELEIRNVSTIKLTEEKLAQIEEEYNKLYKPSIHYSFTKFKIDYRSRIVVCKNTKVIKEGSLYIREAVVNNVESLFEFKIRKLDGE